MKSSHRLHTILISLLVIVLCLSIVPVIAMATQAPLTDNSEIEFTGSKQDNPAEEEEGDIRLPIGSLPAPKPSETVHIHDWVSFDAVEPTCDLSGNIAYKVCSSCGEAQNANGETLEENTWILPALGHTWVNFDAVAPTCTTDGNIAYQQCSVCGAAQTWEENPKPLSRFGWIVGATGHTLEHHDAVEPTCVDNGHEAFDYCSACECFFYEDPLKLSYQDGVILALGHTWVNYEAVAPTCDTEGNIAYKVCSSCGEAQNANGETLEEKAWILPALGHTWVNFDAVAPTCTIDGNIAYQQCSVCGAAQTWEENPKPLSRFGWIVGAIGHTWDNYEAVAPTCDAEGNIAYKVCSSCGEAQNANGETLEENAWILPALGHTWVNFDAVAPTCTTDGNIAYQQCSVCGAAQTWEENPKPLSRFGWIVGATGHTWINYEAVAPTCDTEGNIAYKVCSSCGEAQNANGETLEENAWILPALGHTWVDHEAVAPTCTTDGNIAYQQCSVCGAAQTWEENPKPLSKFGWVVGATGHTWVNYEAVAPTCDTEGNIAYKVCSSCGEAQNANGETLEENAWILPALGHTWVNFDAVAPTCTTDGNIAYQQCSVCGAAQTWEENPVPLGTFGWIDAATGHNYVEGICSVCGAADPEYVPPYILGDYDNNGTVNNDDVVQLLWFSLFPEDYTITGNGDLNHDDQITNDDVVLLLWHTLFPEDYPLV